MGDFWKNFIYFSWRKEFLETFPSFLIGILDLKMCSMSSNSITCLNWLRTRIYLHYMRRLHEPEDFLKHPNHKKGNLRAPYSLKSSDLLKNHFKFETQRTNLAKFLNLQAFNPKLLINSIYLFILNCPLSALHHPLHSTSVLITVNKHLNKRSKEISRFNQISFFKMVNLRKQKMI